MGAENSFLFCIGKAVEIISAAAGFFVDFYDAGVFQIPQLIGNCPAGCVERLDDFVELISRVFRKVCGYFLQKKITGETPLLFFLRYNRIQNPAEILCTVLFCIEPFHILRLYLHTGLNRCIE